MDPIEKGPTTATATETTPTSCEKALQDSGADEAVQNRRDGSVIEDVSTDASNEFVLAWREKVVIGALMVISFFTSLEATGVAVPLPVWNSSKIPCGNPLNGTLS
jgi:hypothetical protein